MRSPAHGDSPSSSSEPDIIKFKYTQMIFRRQCLDTRRLLQISHHVVLAVELPFNIPVPYELNVQASFMEIHTYIFR